PTSWPMTTTRSSLSSAWCSARLMASTMSDSAIRRLDVALERRQGPGFGLLDCSIDPRQCIGDDLPLSVGVPHPAALEVLPESSERVAQPPLLDLGRWLIPPGVVGRGVRPDAIRERLDERRTPAAACPVQRPATDGVHRQCIVAIHKHAGDTLTEPFLRQRLTGGLACAGHADRPVVVLDVEHG